MVLTVMVMAINDTYSNDNYINSLTKYGTSSESKLYIN